MPGPRCKKAILNGWGCLQSRWRERSSTCAPLMRSINSVSASSRRTRICARRQARREMSGAKEFATRKPRGCQIRVARGKVIDTAALFDALDGKRVAAAGLDVTEPEPLLKGHPLWSRNVIITPHTAGQSPGGERRRHEVFRENLRRFAAGEMLLNVVDKKASY